MDEEQIIIAFVFRRNGKNEISYSKFYLTLSIELKWFTPEKAKEFVEFSIKHNLLEKKEDVLSPTFNISNINIPLGFSPSKDIREKEIITKKEEYTEEIFEIILKKIIEKTGKNENEIRMEIKEITLEKNITSEIASLFLCKELSIEINGFLKNIEKKLFT